MSATAAILSKSRRPTRLSSTCSRDFGSHQCILSSLKPQHEKIASYSLTGTCFGCEMLLSMSSTYCRRREHVPRIGPHTSETVGVPNSSSNTERLSLRFYAVAPKCTRPTLKTGQEDPFTLKAALEFYITSAPPPCSCRSNVGQSSCSLASARLTDVLC